MGGITFAPFFSLFGDICCSLGEHGLQLEHPLQNMIFACIIVQIAAHLKETGEYFKLSDKLSRLVDLT